MKKEDAIELFEMLKNEGVHVLIGLKSGRELQLYAIESINDCNASDMISVTGECDGTYFISASSIEFVHV